MEETEQEDGRAANCLETMCVGGRREEDRKEDNTMTYGIGRGKRTEKTEEEGPCTRTGARINRGRTNKLRLCF